MKTARIAVTVLAGAMLYGGSVQAQTYTADMAPVEGREPHPGSAALAAAGNVLFVPVRVSLAAVGGVLGGLTGWLTAGNSNAAHDVWSLPPFDGQQYLQPEMMYGEEPLMVGSLEYRMHITKP